MKQQNINTILAIIAVVVIVAGLFSLVGKEPGSDEPALAEFEADMEQLASEADQLGELAPAAGGEVAQPEELPSNEEVQEEVFEFNN